MNIESKVPPFVALTLATSLLTGCAVEKNFTPPVITSTESTLSFQSAPEADFSISDCEAQPDTWAVQIDSDPTDSIDADRTVGFTSEHNEEMYPVAVKGATIRALGGFAYEIVTSDDTAGSTTKVDLSTESFAKVIKGGDGYDIAVTARIGSKDGSAYFRANCLPDFGFPYVEEAPEDEVPILPLTPALPPAFEA